MPRSTARSRLLKNWPARLAAIARRHDLAVGEVEIWFPDEARIGQNNKITRRWAKRGTRPSAPHDQHTASTYIFGAICPAEGKAVGLILPFCNIAAMNLHLAAISADVAPGRHAVLLSTPSTHVSTLRHIRHVREYRCRVRFSSHLPQEGGRGLRRWPADFGCRGGCRRAVRSYARSRA